MQASPQPAKSSTARQKPHAVLLYSATAIGGYLDRTITVDLQIILAWQGFSQINQQIYVYVTLSEGQ